MTSAMTSLLHITSAVFPLHTSHSEAGGGSVGSGWRWFSGVSWRRVYGGVFLYLVVTEMVLGMKYPEGYCQVFSYNIEDSTTSEIQKHFFACCNNLDNNVCRGQTYQTPTRKEEFCRGSVVKQEGNHWTQMETTSFPDRGRFYCGGCCGQHLAWEACNRQMTRKWPGCMNWVQCYQTECHKIVEAVLANEPLKCTLPPPPHPKHYIHETRTLPYNLSKTLHNPVTSPQDLSLPDPPCSTAWCKAVPLKTRCTTQCCEKYCCLPEDDIRDPGENFIGLSSFQVAAIVGGCMLTLTLLVACILCGIRRCIPGWSNFQLHQRDTQILVIEGPDDVDSDNDSST